jgi:REP element-mobilizing transposase RayT
MNRGVDRAPIFFGDPDRVEFGRRLAEIHTEFNVSTLAYCLMGNHYHLLLRSPMANLSEAMHHLASVYVRHTNDRVGRDGPLFRSRYHAIPVTTDEYLMWVSRYIHRNPLDIVGDRPFIGYRWSSLRTYLGFRQQPSFLDTSVVLAHFQTNADRYMRFVLDSTHDSPPKESIGSLRSSIALAIADEQLAASNDDAPQWLERTALTLIHHDLGDGELRDQLGKLLAYPTAGSRRAALSRARKRAEADSSVGRVLRRIA